MIKQNIKLYSQLSLRYRTEIDLFKQSLIYDKFDLELNQLKKNLKEVEKDEDKCAYYELLSKLEEVEAEKNKIPRVKIKLLEPEPANQFKNPGKYNLETLFWYLWDNSDILAEFVHNYLIPECNQNFKLGNSDKANKLISLVVHQLFLEPTSQV